MNAIGANMANRREVDGRTIKRASLIAVDSLEQSRGESGDLILGLPEAERGWEDVIELHQVVAGKHPGRTSPEAVTIFKSNGIALWDLAVAARFRPLRDSLPRGSGLVAAEPRSEDAQSDYRRRPDGAGPPERAALEYRDGSQQRRDPGRNPGDTSPDGALCWIPCLLGRVAHGR